MHDDVVTDADPAPTTARDPLTAAGLSDSRIDRYLTAGRLRVDGEPVTDLDALAPTGTRVVVWTEWTRTVGFTPVPELHGEGCCRLRDPLDDPAAAYLWIATILAGIAAMLVVRDARMFVIVWATAGLAADVLVHLRRDT
jgi:hypothetical protein